MKVESLSLMMDCGYPVEGSHKPARAVKGIGDTGWDGGVMSFNHPVWLKERNIIVASLVELSDQVVSHILRAGNEIARGQKSAIER